MNNKYNWQILISVVLIPIVFTMAVFVFQRTSKDLVRAEVLPEKEIVVENFDELEKDSDGDGLSDAVENVFYTDINKADTDGDGYTDRDEIERKYNPLSTGEAAEYRTLKGQIEKERYYKKEEDAFATKLVAESSVARDDRLYKEATLVVDKKTCVKIDNLDKQKSCIYDVILIEQGYANCEKIMDIDEKEVCQKNIKYSRAVCDQLSFDKSRQSICYREGAVVFEDFSFCDKQQGMEDEDFCIINYAHFTGDLSVCETIIDLRRKNMCLSPPLN